MKEENEKNTKLEIERKWLLKDMPAFKDAGSCIIIEQYYDRKNKRYRECELTKEDFSKSVFKYFLTRKEELNSGVYNETEIEISKTEYEKAIKKCNKLIRKTRVVYKSSNPELKYEVDYYDNLHLIILEIEFPYENYEFTLPKFIQEKVILEVTNIPEFKNINLALKI